MSDHPPNDPFHGLEDILRALSLPVMKQLHNSGRTFDTLKKLYSLLSQGHQQENSRHQALSSDQSPSEIFATAGQAKLKRNELIDHFDRPFHSLQYSETGRLYSETPGELCARLISLTLSIDADLSLQNDVTMTKDARMQAMDRVDQLHAWRSYLQQCLKQTLTDIEQGHISLPPRSHFTRKDNPYVDPVTRQEISVDIYSFAKSAPRSLGSIDHILGLACTGHGASLTYIARDGTMRSSVFDRWAGTKHTLLMSRDERDGLLHGTSPIAQEVRDLLVYSYSRFPAHQLFEEVFSDWLDWLLSGLDVSPGDIDLVVSSESLFVTSSLRLATQLNRWLPKAHVVTNVEHHVAHQRQAFWPSGFHEAAVLTLDTCGESLTRLNDHKICGTISRMNRNGGGEVLREFIFPHSSPGLIYSIVNHHLGFSQGQEGKTMGLAPYGRPELYNDLVKHLRLYPDGSCDFLSYRELQSALKEYEYERPRTRDAEFTQKHSDIAFSGQAIIEDILTNAFQAALRLTGLRQLAFAGGIGLNSVANEIANRATTPDSLYIPPNPGDAGQALGYALYGAHEIAGWPPPEREIPEYLGPPYDTETILKAVHSSDYPKLQTQDPEDIVARSIANGHIIARFSCQAEFGPRALGNRSILADPRRHDMKDHLNRRVKHREGFRPYAPSVLLEKVSEWFDLDDRSPYMLRVVNVPKEIRDLIPAIVHIDGTARVQTVDKGENPCYWKLIDAFYRLTEVPLLVNTSFNIAGKPIVETPQDAVDCFSSTDIDILLLEDWILSKHPIDEFLNVSR